MLGRDRQLAAQARYGPRRAVALADALDDFRGSAEYGAMRRFARVNGAIAAVLPAAASGRVRPLALRSGVLTLEVADGVLLAELRATIARRLLVSLAAAGTGVSRLAWRVARRG